MSILWLFAHISFNSYINQLGPILYLRIKKNGKKEEEKNVLEIVQNKHICNFFPRCDREKHNFQQEGEFYLFFLLQASTKKDLS